MNKVKSMLSPKIVKLTFAYIHSQETLIWGNNVQRRLPDEIKYICCMYGDTYDQWDANMKHPFMKVNHTESTVIHHNTHQYGTIFGQLVCKTGNLYQWQLRVLDNDSKISHRFPMTIGIIKASFTLFGQKITVQLKGYDFSTNFLDALAGYGYKSRHYLTQFGRKGDIIIMRLDLRQNKNTLSYTVNGNHMHSETVSVDKKFEYKFAVSIPSGVWC
eukprot:UN11095